MSTGKPFIFKSQTPQFWLGCSVIGVFFLIFTASIIDEPDEKLEQRVGFLIFLVAAFLWMCYRHRQFTVDDKGLTFVYPYRKRFFKNYIYHYPYSSISKITLGQGYGKGPLYIAVYIDDIYFPVPYHTEFELKKVVALFEANGVPVICRKNN